MSTIIRSGNGKGEDGTCERGFQAHDRVLELGDDIRCQPQRLQHGKPLKMLVALHISL
jgi:hypothetical protein